MNYCDNDFVVDSVFLDHYIRHDNLTSYNCSCCLLTLHVQLVLLVLLIYKIFFSATKVYIDDVLTCRAWKRDSVAKKKRLSS